jgi:hypothetical protein
MTIPFVVAAPFPSPDVGGTFRKTVSFEGVMPLPPTDDGERFSRTVSSEGDVQLPPLKEGAGLGGGLPPGDGGEYSMTMPFGVMALFPQRLEAAILALSK